MAGMDREAQRPDGPDETEPCEAEPRPGAPAFDAILEPHRSLDAGGFAVLMAAVGLIGLGGGVAFLSIGAWPVAGFLGLDVLAVWLAFRLNYRDGRGYERLRLTRDRLTVVRVSARGRIQRAHFQPYWLRVEFDDPPRHDSQLRLSSHGRSLVVGSFLAPRERLELARALEATLGRLRAPREAV